RQPQNRRNLLHRFRKNHALRKLLQRRRPVESVRNQIFLFPKHFIRPQKRSEAIRKSRSRVHPLSFPDSKPKIKAENAPWYRGASLIRSIEPPPAETASRFPRPPESNPAPSPFPSPHRSPAKVHFPP